MAAVEVLTRARARSAPSSAASEYADLKRTVQALGLLKAQPRYYVFKFALTGGLLAVAFLAMTVSGDQVWIRLFEAAFLAFAFVQVGLLAHDLAHQQIVGSGRLNVALGLLLGNFLFGVSRAWWRDNHDAHHAHPNDLDADPNVQILFLACAPEQAMGRPKWVQWVIKHQVALLVPIFCLEYFSMHYQSLEYVFQRRPGTVRGEGIVLIAHLVLYGTVLYATLGFTGAILFGLLHQALTGLYLASIFAPNHKGMPLSGGDAANQGFLREQAQTARNIRSNGVIDLVYGGLNYQVEHHLFPTMPRNNLRLVQPVVQAFCASHGVAYSETSVVQSWREIFAQFGSVSRALPLTPRQNPSLH
jgi:fatty acid desaturase